MQHVICGEIDLERSCIMTNLKLYITEDDYNVAAGSDWPTYENFLNGTTSDIPQVREEIIKFINNSIDRGVKFPINTKTACQSKWTWSTIYLNSMSTASCHRVNPVKFDVNDFDNFHNTPEKLLQRKTMLNGQWPKQGCEACEYVELAGGWSDRQHNLEIRGMTPPELETDPTAIIVTPRLVEIFAQNTCNLSCLYCNSSLSSKISQEAVKFGAFEQNGVRIPAKNIPDTTAEYFARFLEWLEKNIQVLTRLHLLGGETFIQHELMTSVLDIIERNPNSKLSLCVFSNLNVPDKYWDLYVGRIKDLQKAGNLNKFDLTASIDCWGPEQEFVRYGLNLDKFEQRFAWASEQDESWLRLNVNQTITSMTIKTMPDLIAKVNQYRKHRHIGHYFQFLTGHNYLHPRHFGYALWEKDFEKILRIMPTDTVHQREVIPRMQGMQKQLQQSTTDNYKLIGQLHTYLNEMDRRRGTNWRELFSYLDVKMPATQV